MKTINKIFSGIRKIVAFPFTAAGILILISGIIVIAMGIGIAGNSEKLNTYLNEIIEEGYEDEETEENFIEDESEEWQNKKLNA